MIFGLSDELVKVETKLLNANPHLDSLHYRLTLVRVVGYKKHSLSRYWRDFSLSWPSSSPFTFLV